MSSSLVNHEASDWSSLPPIPRSRGNSRIGPITATVDSSQTYRSAWCTTYICGKRWGTTESGDSGVDTTPVSLKLLLLLLLLFNTARYNLRFYLWVIIFVSNLYHGVSFRWSQFLGHTGRQTACCILHSTYYFIVHTLFHIIVHYFLCHVLSTQRCLMAYVRIPHPVQMYDILVTCFKSNESSAGINTCNCPYKSTMYLQCSTVQLKTIYGYKF